MTSLLGIPKLILPEIVQRFRPRLQCDLFMVVFSSLALPCFCGVYTGYPPCVFVMYFCEVLAELKLITNEYFFGVLSVEKPSQIYIPHVKAHVNQLSNKQTKFLNPRP